MTARILITGSTDGIGLAAAQLLLTSSSSSSGAHPQIYLHARNESRAETLNQTLRSSKTTTQRPAAGILIADLSTLSGAQSLANQINSLPEPLDSIIHNAGLGPRTTVTRTADNHASTIAVNVLSPYIVTALLHPDRRPRRTLYLSSSLHYSGSGDLSGVDASWARYGGGDAHGAYNDSKLHDVLLAFAVARRWAGQGEDAAKKTQVCALDPGWIRTKMGGAGAPGEVGTPAKAIAEFALGRLGFVGEESGLYFTPQGLRGASAVATKVEKQEELLERCARATGVAFPEK